MTKTQLMVRAHKLTKKLKKEFPMVDYKFQLGLCMTYLQEDGQEEKLEKNIDNTDNCPYNKDIEIDNGQGETTMNKKEYFRLHTSDMISYRRCRRKWLFSSPMKMNLTPKKDSGLVSSALWLGTGFHFGLEMLQSKKWDKASEAFEAFVEAHNIIERPEDWSDLKETGIKMLEYYQTWEEKFGKWETLYIDGQPQVEVNFELELPGLYKDGTPIAFSGTFDRIVRDTITGGIWVMDYKTAKQFNTSKLDLDFQVSSYAYAAEQYLGMDIEGVIYVQVSKNTPQEPKILKNGSVSTDKRQRTTYALYEKACKDVYGDITATPQDNIDFLEMLYSQEQDTENNQFVNVQWVERNPWARISFFNNMMLQAKEMCQKDLALYPNPTMDCSWDCPFKAVCMAMMEGADYECYFEDFEVREDKFEAEQPEWLQRLYIAYPNRFMEEN